jgi:hypothetical protein
MRRWMNHTGYDLRDCMKNDEMNGMCYTYWRWEKCVERARRRWQYNIKKKGNARTTKHWDVRVYPLLQRKSNKYCIFWVYVCILIYLACNAHAPYFICGLPVCTNFSTRSHKRHDFRKRKVRVLIFSKLLSEAFLILRKTDWDMINPLTPALNPSTQRFLTRFFTGDFASWIVHFVNVCAKNQQIHQLFTQFINYVW